MERLLLQNCIESLHRKLRATIRHRTSRTNYTMSKFYHVKNTIQRPILQDTKDEEPGHFLDNLRENLKIDITFLNESEIQFDMSGVDVSIANALRRIFIAEVPTIAIETVWMADNTSIIQDEVLSHRVGLIPIKADPSLLDAYIAGEEETASDTLVFNFDVSCRVSGNETMKAMSGALNWVPQGSQEDLFKDGVAPVHDDIPIALLGNGQCIEFEAHCHKGIGKDHAKYSPVATAAYRLLPVINFPAPVTQDAAYQLRDMCPMNVFDIEDIIDSDGETVPTAVVSRPRDCTMCRECIRLEGWESKVQLTRKADHFIFSVESTGCIPPEDIVRQGIAVLKDKAVKFHSLVLEYENSV